MQRMALVSGTLLLFSMIASSQASGCVRMSATLW